MKTFFLKFFTWWNSQTFGTQFTIWRDGVFVGEDEFGNKYFENTAYQSGRHRWVEYADLVRVHLNHFNSRTCTGNQ